MTAAMTPGAKSGSPLAFEGARLIDPESGYDGPGCVVVSEGVIADVQRRPKLEAGSAAMKVVDCSGAMLSPGLVDMRVKTGEPGAEPKETLKSASRPRPRRHLHRGPARH